MSSYGKGNKFLKSKKTLAKPPVPLRAAEYSDFEEFSLFKNANHLIQQFIGENTASNDKKNLAPKSYVCKVKKGQKLTLIRQGVMNIYLIKKGYFSLSLKSAYAEEGQNSYYFVALRGPDQILGETRPLTGIGQYVSILALTDCELVEVPADLFIKTADENSILYRNLVELIIKKAFDEARRVDLIQSDYDNREKLIYTLLWLYEERGHTVDKKGHHVINGIITQGFIAGYLGLSRKTVHDLIEDLNNLGLIEGGSPGPKNPSLKILDIKKLKEIVPNFK